MLVCWYTFLNWRCLPEPPATVLGSILAPWGADPVVSVVGLSSTRRSRTPLVYCSGTPFACYSGAPVTYFWGTPSPTSNCPSVRVLHGGAFMLGGGATGAPSSFDHSDIAALRVRVVRSPPSKMPPGLRGAAPTIFLYF